MLSPFAIAAIVAGCSFGAALVGMVLHVKLPDHHLDADSQDMVKLVMGLIATMSALVLSLLIASASASYNQQSGELKTALRRHHPARSDAGTLRAKRKSGA